MGQTCSSACQQIEQDALASSRTESPDPVMFDLMRKSIIATTPTDSTGQKTGKKKQLGQNHLLFRNAKMDGGNLTSSSDVTTVLFASDSDEGWLPDETPVSCPTRLLIRRQSLRVVEEAAGTHIYAIRYPEDTTDKVISEQAATVIGTSRQEQCPTSGKTCLNQTGGKDNSDTQAQAVVAGPSRPTTKARTKPKILMSPALMDGVDVYSSAAIASKPKQKIMDWVTVSEDHKIFVADAGLTASQCDHIVSVCEHVCRGQYAAYTYAKQTLGCREYPVLARTCFAPVHTVTTEIIRRLGIGNSQKLQLDDREPHIVKYDVTKKERQKLDMHTDKSEWTFLIALSNGCGVDYEGGGTYFECLDATVHVQRGHALIFPGKLRHCGQKIMTGLRFLLVGFLVDKQPIAETSGGSNGASNADVHPNDPSQSNKCKPGIQKTVASPVTVKG